MYVYDSTIPKQAVRIISVFILTDVGAIDFSNLTCNLLILIT